MAEERYKKADFEDLIEESILMTLSMTQTKKNIFMNHFLRYSKISITMKRKFAG